MKPVNKSAKKILDLLTEGVTESKKIDNTNGAFMPVSVECLGTVNLGTLFSVTHYGEQNGDLMADPDVVFLKDKDGNYFPCSFRNDYVGVNKESVIFDGPEITGFYAKEQADEAVFASQWMKNIKEQQGL